MTDRDNDANDGLDGALVALCDEQIGRDDATAAETRRRVLLAATRRRRGKLLLLRVVVPLAAVIAIGTAWAAAGRRLPWVERGQQAPQAAPSTQPDLRTTESPSPPPIEVLSPSPARRLGDDAGRDAGVDHAFDAGAPAIAVRPTSALDREDALYRQAHKAHFVARDAARALVAWDRYLAGFPRGRLAPEARYNRALVLVRLGRTDEARAALAPFADAPIGSYRQDEARSLLDAIR